MPPLAARLDTHPAALATEQATGRLGTRRALDVMRDFAVLVTVCLSVGLMVGAGVMLAVLALS